jgi:glycosyltransferase involved in cell wall biosynthesis
MDALAMSLRVQFQTHVSVPEAELIDFLNRASLLLYAPRLEPFGFAPLEANACETPVVALAEGGIRETIQDGVNGFLVQDPEPEALGEAMLRILEDAPLGRRLGRSGRAQVASCWNLQAATDRLEQFMLQTLAQRHNGKHD